MTAFQSEPSDKIGSRLGTDVNAGYQFGKGGNLSSEIAYFSSHAPSCAEAVCCLVHPGKEPTVFGIDGIGESGGVAVEPMKRFPASPSPASCYLGLL